MGKRMTKESKRAEKEEEDLLLIEKERERNARKRSRGPYRKSASV